VVRSRNTYKQVNVIKSRQNKNKLILYRRVDNGDRQG
jgi:hypothetical protein